MITYPIYAAIKERLKNVAPCFFFINQYATGKGNTKYIVPAIYIEILKNLNIVYWGRGIRAAKSVPIRIHIINNAPFRAHDNIIQDSALAAHNKMLKDIDERLENKHLHGNNGRKLSEVLLHTGSNEINYTDGQVVSIITYTTDLYF